MAIQLTVLTFGYSRVESVDSHGDVAVWTAILVTVVAFGRSSACRMSEVDS